MHVGGIPLTASLRCVCECVCMCHGAGRRHQVLCFFPHWNPFSGCAARCTRHVSLSFCFTPPLLPLVWRPPSQGVYPPNQLLSHPVNLKQSEFNSSCPSARQPERDRNRPSKRLTLNVPRLLFLYVYVSLFLSLCVFIPLKAFCLPSFLHSVDKEKLRKDTTDVHLLSSLPI